MSGKGFDLESLLTFVIAESCAFSSIPMMIATCRGDFGVWDSLLKRPVPNSTTSATRHRPLSRLQCDVMFLIALRAGIGLLMK